MLIVDVREGFGEASGVFNAHLCHVTYAVVDIETAVVGEVEPCCGLNVCGVVDSRYTIVLRHFLIFELYLHLFGLVDAFLKTFEISSVVTVADLTECCLYKFEELAVVDEDIFDEKIVGFVGVECVFDCLADYGCLVVDVLPSFVLES